MKNRAISIIEIIRRPSDYPAGLVNFAVESMPALLRSMQDGRQKGACSFMEDWSAPCSFLLADGSRQRCFITLTLED